MTKEKAEHKKICKSDFLEMQLDYHLSRIDVIEKLIQKNK